MSSLTDYLGLVLPDVLGDFNTWGTGLNSSITSLDKYVFSKNFAEGVHAGLNFYYESGKILNENSSIIVVAGNITLTGSATNYIEVSPTGTVSSNTSGFTKKSIPLYVAICSGTDITTITDYRATMQNNINDVSTLTSNIIGVDSNGNLLLNESTAETNQKNAISIKQGSTDPTTQTIDQITLFATSGPDSTIGLITEYSINNDLLKLKINNDYKYIYVRENTSKPISSFITNTFSIGNTTTETEIMTYTLPGKTNPAGQVIEFSLMFNIWTDASSDAGSITLQVGADTLPLANRTSTTYSNEDCFIKGRICIKDTTQYTMSMMFFTNDESPKVSNADFTEIFTTDTIIRLTCKWNVAKSGSYYNFYAGYYDIKS